MYHLKAFTETNEQQQCFFMWIIIVVLRESARTPLARWFGKQQQPQVLLTGPPVLTMPDPLLAGILSFCRPCSTLWASRTCRSAHAQLWQNPVFWRNLLHCFGVADTSLQALQRDELSAWLNAGRKDKLRMAKAFQDFARYWLSGVDVLVGRPVQLKSNGVVSAIIDRRRRNGEVVSLDLEDARRGVIAMQPEDDEALIQCVADSVTNLLSNRASGESERLKSEELLEAVAIRSDVFSTAQMLDMLGADQKATEEGWMLPGKLPEQQSGWPCRRARCRTAMAMG